ncbi:MAG: histidine phosphatase family protein [Deltaproteobacteria bacterium]|jgi:probable phosphoglycerate mutase|nr:histidine phosphatase family protein [Deltaproteobacteria bacterium]
MKRIILIRHGQTTAPPRAMISRSDYPLSQTGLNQAYLLAERLQDPEYGPPESKPVYFYGPDLNPATLQGQEKTVFKPDLALTSPLQRARQTAQIVLKSCNITPRVVDDFREIELGLFEGLTSLEAQSRYPRAWAERGLDLFNSAPPEGESYAQLAQRVLPAYNSILDQNNKATEIVIIAHRAVIQVILAAETALPLDQAPKIQIQRGEMKILIKK